jgi:hypothetical protein
MGTIANVEPERPAGRESVGEQNRCERLTQASLAILLTG